MKELTEREEQELWEEVQKEFPDDEMMQEIHFIRLVHYHQTKGLSPEEYIRFFHCTEETVSG